MLNRGGELPELINLDPDKEEAGNPINLDPDEGEAGNPINLDPDEDDIEEIPLITLN